MRAANHSGSALGASGPPSSTVVGFHGAVSEFKRRLIEATLTQMGGNRTRTARALGLQRTYLLRLMREFGITIPPPPSSVAMPPSHRPRL
jgi:DNA-binding NtrC family response regulator